MGYLHDTLHTAAAQTKALYITENNLPQLTNEYNQVRLPSGDISPPTPYPTRSSHIREPLRNWNKS